MILPNFENWSNGELTKIGHHFRFIDLSNGSYQKISTSKNERKIEKDLDDF